jgi:sulfide:quinone oxidoreductase
LRDQQTVLILGAGIGGLVAARTLRQSLPKTHRIILVDRESTFVFAPSLLWLMTGDRTPKTISRPLARIERKGIQLVYGNIERIDPERREVRVSGQTIAGDYMIIALGAELAPETIPGLTEAGHNFYTLAGASSLKESLERFTGGKLVILTAAPAYKCPAAPYEAAMLLESYCRKHKIREKTSIDLYAAEPGPMGVAGPEVSMAVRAMVEANGLTYHPEHQVKEVDPNARLLRFTNGAEAQFDLLAYVPPHRPPAVVRDTGLAEQAGWVTVNRETMETRFDRVYALGDVVGIPLKLGKPLPKAGVFAQAEAEVVAQRITHAITGSGKLPTFDGHGACFIETGDGKAGYGAGNFYAEPVPQMTMHPPARRWHAGKVLFEKLWLSKWF